MSGMDGLDLFELFKGEVETHGAALNTGLLRLESAPDDVLPIAALMRAAHSIKGAARVVGIDPVVGLAHAMEDALVRVQKGLERCTTVRVDQLLQATDLLGSLRTLVEGDLPDWCARHATEMNTLVTALAAPAPEAEAPAEPAAPTTPAVNLPVAPLAPAADLAPAAGTAVPTTAALGQRVSPASDLTPPRTAEPAVPEVRTVRVNADNLDRMLRLAGESMVEGRRFPQVQRGLRELKSRLRASRGALDDASRRGHHADVQEARQQLADLERALQRHAALLEATFRRTEEVGARLYHEVIGSRMRPFGDATAGFPRLVRDLSRQLGKKVRFELQGEHTPVDRDVLARLDAPLNHILRNALDHGVEMPDARRAAGKGETASLRLQARHHAGMLEVRVSEDGAGIDPERIRARVIERGLQPAEVAASLGRAELLEFLFLPGFSTARAVTEVSGRGVGLDVVHQTLRELGGRVRIESEPGRGTTFTLSLPITLSVIRAALVQVGGEPLAFPLARVERIVRVPAEQLRPGEGRLHLDLDGAAVGVLRATELLGLPAATATTSAQASLLVLGESPDRCALLVDGFLGERDLVVRPIDERLGRVPHVAAASIDEDGAPLLVMDVEDLLVSIRRGLGEGLVRGVTPQSMSGASAAPRRVLVADDSITVREVERQLLQRMGHHVEVAVDGVDAWNQLCRAQFDLLVTDVDMPRMNGIELVRAVRADPRFANLPVAIVSYKDRPEDRAAGLHAGANAYLTKGAFQDQTFARTVADLIGEVKA